MLRERWFIRFLHELQLSHSQFKRLPNATRIRSTNIRPITHANDFLLTRPVHGLERLGILADLLMLVHFGQIRLNRCSASNSLPHLKQGFILIPFSRAPQPWVCVLYELYRSTQARHCRPRQGYGLPSPSSSSSWWHRSLGTCVLEVATASRYRTAWG